MSHIIHVTLRSTAPPFCTKISSATFRVPFVPEIDAVLDPTALEFDAAFPSTICPREQTVGHVCQYFDSSLWRNPSARHVSRFATAVLIINPGLCNAQRTCLGPCKE